MLRRRGRALAQRGEQHGGASRNQSKAATRPRSRSPEICRGSVGNRKTLTQKDARTPMLTAALFTTAKTLEKTSVRRGGGTRVWRNMPG